MTDERRYQNDEIAAIFEAATEVQPPRRIEPASSDGLTLAELQAIGEEIDVAPERIAEAAAALDLRRDAAPRRASLGMPVSVGRVASLPRAPTNPEWELLLAELRSTFGAHGTHRSSGDVRAWTNGNLHAYIEPTESGWRLRLGTLKGDALAFNRLGIAGIATGLVLFIIMLLTGELANDLGGPVIVALLGAAALGYNALRLPGWASEREQQMEYIAARALALITPSAAPHDPPEAGLESG